MLDKRKGFFLVILCALIAVVIIASGSLFFGREALSVKKSDALLSSESDKRVAKNYDHLKERITDIAAKGQINGVIRLENYSGNIHEDLARVIDDVCQNTPIGAYAVDILTLSATRVMSYYEVTVDINYKRPVQEICNIKPANTTAELAVAMSNAMKGHIPAIALKSEFYTAELISAEKTFEDLRLSDPDSVYGVSNMHVEIFPKQGLHRILLISFDYYESAEESARKCAEAEYAAEEIAEKTRIFTGSERIRKICELIAQDAKTASVLPYGDENTPYGVLVKKNATDIGYASALNKILSENGIYSVVIKGEYAGKRHCWNTLFIDGAWLHIDLSRDIILESEANMADYKWKTSEIFSSVGK